MITNIPAYFENLTRSLNYNYLRYPYRDNVPFWDDDEPFDFRLNSIIGDFQFLFYHVGNYDDFLVVYNNYKHFLMAKDIDLYNFVYSDESEWFKLLDFPDLEFPDNEQFNY